MSGQMLEVEKLLDVADDQQVSCMDRKEKWALRVFDKWCCANGRVGEVLFGETTEELDQTLSTFLVGARQANGRPYSADSLRQIIMSLQRYMRRHHRFVSILTDPQFSQTQAAMAMEAVDRLDTTLAHNTVRPVSAHETPVSAHDTPLSAHDIALKLVSAHSTTARPVPAHDTEVILDYACETDLAGIPGSTAHDTAFIPVPAHDTTGKHVFAHDTTVRPVPAQDTAFRPVFAYDTAIRTTSAHDATVIFAINTEVRPTLEQDTDVRQDFAYNAAANLDSEFYTPFRCVSAQDTVVRPDLAASQTISPVSASDTGVSLCLAHDAALGPGPAHDTTARCYNQSTHTRKRQHYRNDDGFKKLVLLSDVKKGTPNITRKSSFHYMMPKRKKSINFIF